MFSMKSSRIKEWTSCLIFIGHFCGVKDWDQPFSKWISEFRKRADFDTSYHHHFCNSTIENI